MHRLTHIYTGNGKGKTAAGIGMAIRFAGSGGKVLYTQFLKDHTEDELEILRTIPQITVCLPEKSFLFSRELTLSQQNEIRQSCTVHFEKMIRETVGHAYGLLVLDEIILADHLHFIPHEMLLYFMKAKPENLELILTGRNAAKDLYGYADYISDFQCVRCPDWSRISAQPETGTNPESESP